MSGSKDLQILHEYSVQRVHDIGSVRRRLGQGNMPTTNLITLMSKILIVGRRSVGLYVPRPYKPPKIMSTIKYHAGSIACLNARVRKSRAVNR